MKAIVRGVSVSAFQSFGCEYLLAFCQVPVVGAEGVSFKSDGILSYYHRKCFKCLECFVVLSDGAEFFVQDKKAFCQVCYKTLLGSCHVCGEFLDEGGVVKALDKKYHPKVSCA
jgi:hypothetical protein